MTKKIAIQRGFTLIEVMVVVVIVGILAAFALPAYKDYVLRSKIAEATSNLESARTDMERYFHDKRTFATVGAVNPPCLTSRALEAFDLVCAAPTQNGYVITAKGRGIASGFSYTINQLNERKTTAAGPGYVTCNNSNGWMTRKGQTC